VEHSFLKTNKKGQVSIEFVILILFMLVYISSVAGPMVASANNTAEEISALGSAKIASQKLANAIDEVSLAPKAKKTVSVFVPENSILEIDSASKTIKFRVEMKNSENPKPCPPGEENCCKTETTEERERLVCSGQAEFTAGNVSTSLNYNPSAPGENNLIIGKTFAEITVYNNGSAISVSYA